MAILLFNCKQESRYTQNSKEIDVVKTIIKAYEDKDWETLINHYADSSKTIFNSSNMASKEIPNYHKQNDVNYETRGFIDEGQEFEMVTDDEGKTWVNFWGTWKGKLKATGKECTIPVHLTSRFIDGKIVEEYGYWDPTEIVLALQEVEAKNKLPDAEKTILANINTFIDQFLNKQDANSLDQILAKNYSRYFNDQKVASGSKELETTIAPFFKGFPDFKIKLLNKSEIIDNAIFVHWKMTATHSGEFAGTPATGKKVTVKGLSRLHFNNEGKMDMEHLYFDQLNLMQQIGKTLN
jgi:steroid delta-isomerase-like uncharacterized protein